MKRITAAAAVLLLLALPTTVSAQLGFGPDEEWSVRITPRIGHLTPGESGPLTGWQPEGLRIVGGPAAGLALELTTPIPWVSLRATMDRALRNNLGLDPNRVFAPDAPFLQSLQGASAVQAQYSIGGLLRPLPNLPVRPTAMLGLGVRYWSWDPGNLATRLVPRFPESEWDRSWHWGAGVEADAAPFGVRIEVVNHRARVDTPDAGSVSATDRFVMVALSWTGRN